MKNIPRIYIDEPLAGGKQVKLSDGALHYLQKVMRADKFLAFNGGKEFHADLSVIGSETGRADPSNGLTLAFAPIKQARLEEMLSMATQMGVAKLQPVITDRVNEHHVKWDRIRKIIIEAAEQSGRNSVPLLAASRKFDEFLQMQKNLVFADERLTDSGIIPDNFAQAQNFRNDTTILIGPEGGFSDKEFAALDKAVAVGIGLGKTILRAETAAVAAIAKILG